MQHNRFSFIGRLGRPPEMRYTPSGQAVTNLNVAVSNKYTNAQGEKIDETMWVRVSVWGKNAEACNQYLEQGQEVFVEGTLVFDKATGSPRLYAKNDGSMGASFEVKAFTVQFGEKKRGASQQQAAKPQQSQQAQNYAPPMDDDIPF